MADAPQHDRPQLDDGPEEAPYAWPVETDIYILPSGEVVVADLPDELRELIQTVGIAALPDEIEPYVANKSD